jgi:hypothetical protein
MKTLAEYGQRKIEKANAAIEAIANGGTFNGTVYAKATKKDMYMVSVYVSKQEFCFGEIQKGDVDAIKAEFLAVTNSTVGTEKLPAGRFGQGNYEFGTENWLYSGMNGE